MVKLTYKQIADFLNMSTREVIGEEATAVLEDLSNIVDFGTSVQGLGKTIPLLDDFVGRITRVIFYERTYGINTDLGIWKDNVEYGLCVQRMSIDELPEAEDNPTWQITDGVSVDPFVVKLPHAKARYFEKRNTAEIDMTILRRQYNAAFTSPTEMATFVGMIFNSVENSRSLKINNLQKAILRAAMSATLKKKYPTADYSAHSEITAVNLLKLYNDEVNPSSPLTKEKARFDKEFLRFASMVMNDYVRAVKEMSVLYNIEEAPRFTPDPKIVVLGKFADACQYYLESDTYHNTLVSLPGYSTMDSWQATPSRDFDELSKINVKNDDGDTVELSGIVACLYDSDGLAVTVNDPRVLSQPNNRGEYDNYFWKYDWASCCFKDMNFVVFFIA